MDSAEQQQFYQQIADTIAKITGRSVTGVSLSRDSTDSQLIGTFTTDAGEVFDYVLAQVNGKYTVKEARKS